MITKSYPSGANYVYSILTSYNEPIPDGFEVPEGKYYNKYFSGGVIGMPEPLIADGLVTYTDQTNPTKDQMAKDVVNFLQWASEPELEDRKKTGITFLSFFIFFTIILYLLKRRIWQDVK